MARGALRRLASTVAAVAVAAVAVVTVPAAAAGASAAASTTPTPSAASVTKVMEVTPVPPAAKAGIAKAEKHNAVGVAVLDLQTGDYYGSKHATTQYPSESVVKVLIAARLLAQGKMHGRIEKMSYRMITQSDDNDADALWGVVSGPDVVGWAEKYFGVSDLGASPTTYGHWGNTKFTARGLVELLAAVTKNTTVGPWLVNAMSHIHRIAADGTHQFFGLPHETTDGAFKQGWGADSDDGTDQQQLNSIALLDKGRYAVALMVQHNSQAAFSAQVPVINALAAAVTPDGKVVMVTVPPVTKTPAPTTRTSAPPSRTTPPASTPPSSTAPSSTIPSSTAPSSAATSGEPAASPTPSTPLPAGTPGDGSMSALRTVMTGDAHLVWLAAVLVASLAAAAAIVLGLGRRRGRHSA